MHEHIWTSWTKNKCHTNGRMAPAKHALPALSRFWTVATAHHTLEPHMWRMAGGCSRNLSWLLVLRSEWHWVQKKNQKHSELYLLLKCTEMIWEHSVRTSLRDHLGFHFTGPTASIVAYLFSNLCHFWRMDVSLRPLALWCRSLNDSKWNCHKRACQLVLPSAFSLPSRSLAAKKKACSHRTGRGAQVIPCVLNLNWTNMPKWPKMHQTQILKLSP